ncbi:MAG TPA: WGxxGxxG family protein [Thermomicrobiales bacterium]|nr:WGxxGxxG family protein [Thermomicrobiales bacterium]
MTTGILVTLRAAAIALVLAFGMVTVGHVSAQDASPATNAVSEATNEDEGFDDWGLLGLLGLAGLAGLLRRPQPVVHTTDRTTEPRR